MIRSLRARGTELGIDSRRVQQMFDDTTSVSRVEAVIETWQRAPQSTAIGHVAQHVGIGKCVG